MAAEVGGIHSAVESPFHPYAINGCEQKEKKREIQNARKGLNERAGATFMLVGNA